MAPHETSGNTPFGGEVDAATLTRVARQALGDANFSITDWSCRSVSGGRASTTAGIYRFTGGGHGACAETWSVIVKVIRREGGSESLADRQYWQREPLVLRSGLLKDLPPGLRAPRCFELQELPDTIRVWMEDVAESAERPWPLDRFSLAARHLGNFNGSYVSDRVRPDFPWLTRDLLRGYVTMHEEELALLARRADDPLVRRGWPGTILTRVRQLWDEREALLDLIARTPQTLCHGDPSDQNLLADGETTVAIDWAFTGIGALGEDLAVLLRSRLPGAISFAALDVALFEGYLAGLREAGWNGDARIARFGYTAAVALRYALNCFPVRAFGDEALRARFEESLDRSIEELVDWAAALRAFALDRADEARSLATVVR